MTEFRNRQCRSTWKMTCISIYDGSSFGSSYTWTTWCPDDWLNILWLSVVVWMSYVSNWLMFLDIWSLDGNTVLEGSETFRGWSLVGESMSLAVRAWGLIAQFHCLFTLTIRCLHNHMELITSCLLPFLSYFSSMMDCNIP